MNQKPIRILHVIGIMNRGGAEVMIMNLYRNIDREKIQFDFVENSSEPAAFDEEILALGGRIYRCPQYNGKNRFAYARWWNTFMKEHHQEYKIVHGHVGRSASIYLRIAKKYGVYTISHSHTTGILGIKNILYQIYSFPVRKSADYYFACSINAGKSRYGKKIVNSSKKFFVLNNAIDTSEFSYNEVTRKIIRKKYGIENKKVIGHIGRFVPPKNHKFILDIFGKVHKEDSNTVLLLVGDGELRSEIEKKAQKMELRDYVIFAGNQEDTSPFYQAMDLFLFPSLYEGLSLATVEAQSSGVNCIISNHVSTECIITENQVFVCDLDASIEQWSDMVLDKLIYVRKSGAEYVKKHGYDIHQTAKWLMEFYMEE